MFQWIETTGLLLKWSDSPSWASRPNLCMLNCKFMPAAFILAVCSSGCIVSNITAYLTMPFKWPVTMTSASQLLYSRAYYSGPRPCLLPVTDVDHVFCFLDVKIFIFKKAFTWWILIKYIIVCPNYFSPIHFSSTNTPLKWTIPLSDIQTWVWYCHLKLNVLLAFGKFNIWHIWIAPWEHWLWPFVSTCMILLCFFLYLPSSSFFPSSSPPTPPPCQACPRCSHTRDPSARCKEPSSPRSAHDRQTYREFKEACTQKKSHKLVYNWNNTFKC